MHLDLHHLRQGPAREQHPPRFSNEQINAAIAAARMPRANGRPPQDEVERLRARVVRYEREVRLLERRLVEAERAHVDELSRLLAVMRGSQANGAAN